MTLFYLSIDNSLVEGAIVGCRIGIGALQSFEVSMDFPMSVGNPNCLSNDEVNALNEITDGKRYSSGGLVTLTSNELLLLSNSWAKNLTASQLRCALRSKLGALVSQCFNLVADPKVYTDAEQRTWSKQEQVAQYWVTNWNDGAPTITLADVPVLVNLCAGELGIAKAAVTIGHVNDKATSILSNAAMFAPYLASVLGVAHRKRDQLNAVDLESPYAKEQLLAVDLNEILAVAAAELGL